MTGLHFKVHLKLLSAKPNTPILWIYSSEQDAADSSAVSAIQGVLPPSFKTLTLEELAQHSWPGKENLCFQYVFILLEMWSSRYVSPGFFGIWWEQLHGTMQGLFVYHCWWLDFAIVHTYLQADLLLMDSTALVIVAIILNVILDFSNPGL